MQPYSVELSVEEKNRDSRTERKLIVVNVSYFQFIYSLCHNDCIYANIPMRQLCVNDSGKFILVFPIEYSILSFVEMLKKREGKSTNWKKKTLENTTKHP